MASEKIPKDQLLHLLAVKYRDQKVFKRDLTSNWRASDCMQIDVAAVDIKVNPVESKCLH